MDVTDELRMSDPSTPEKRGPEISVASSASEPQKILAFTGEEPDVERGTVVAPKGKGERVLLVDNDISVLESTKRLIERLGYRVSALTSSTDALALIHATSVQLNCVVSDLDMPGFTGLQLANTCRLCRPGTPFLLMSGSANVPSPESLSVLGIREFILKPFSARLLAGALDRAMSAGEV